MRASIASKWDFCSLFFSLRLVLLYRTVSGTKKELCSKYTPKMGIVFVLGSDSDYVRRDKKASGRMRIQSARERIERFGFSSHPITEIFVLLLAFPNHVLRM